jgi:predicted PurR-regulated permease PerM
VPRVISFIVLLAILLLVGAIFFQVMAQFIVPLFLACVLLVVFQPLHAWTLRRVPEHPRICALITTVLIMLVVLLPLTWLGWNAYIELRALFPQAKQPVAAAANAPIVRNEVQPSEVALKAVAAQENVATQDANSPNVEDHVVTPEERLAFQERVGRALLDLRNRFEQFTGIKLKEEDIRGITSRVPSSVASTVVSILQSAIKIVIGLAIMVIALYYFLADGPAMIRTVMRLSPLDPTYEQELLARFGDVSRAVVVATLLSAVVQGSLAGIGYSFALPQGAPIFLLTALTMVTAMVPFVGAAAVWIVVCGWIGLYGERMVDGQIQHVGDPYTAIILAIYCTIVVSGIDNVIKPFILHGQSKLHPLLALLSILGGVQVLGPVGILVGPMLVSFLQALLDMLKKELDSFGEGEELAAVLGTSLGDEKQLAMATPAGGVAVKAGQTDGQTAAAKAAPDAAKQVHGRRARRKK